MSGAKGDPTGPGYTRWEADDNGNIKRTWHGDGSWVNVVYRWEESPIQPWKVAHLMNEAYAAGMADKASQIKRTLGL